MCAGAAIKAGDAAAKTSKSWDKAELSSEARRLAVSRGVLSTSISLLNVLRSGMCSVTVIALSVSGMNLTGANVIVGMFPILTVTKLGLELMRYGLDTQFKAKEHESGKPDKTIKGLVVVSGIIAVGQLALSISKIAGWAPPMFLLLGTMFVVASLQVYKVFKDLDEASQRARADKALRDAVAAGNVDTAKAVLAT